jgi:hypothetical protein
MPIPEILLSLYLPSFSMKQQVKNSLGARESRSVGFSGTTPMFDFTYMGFESTSFPRTLIVPECFSTRPMIA